MLTVDFAPKDLVPKYICLDAGGSKIECRVLDAKGRELNLYQNDKEVQAARVDGANVNVVGEARVEEVLRTLFSQVKVVPEGRALQELLSQCKVVVGMAGVAMPGPRAKVAAVFERIGVKKENLELQGDAEMVLTGIRERNAAVVICGTGHVIFGKIDGKIRNEKEQFFRLGGWGPEDDKEPSGYTIGLEGIKAVRAVQAEAGPATCLVHLFRVHFEEDNAQAVRTKISSKEISVAKVASFARAVFDAAESGDRVANAIVEKWFVQEVGERFITFVTNQRLDGDGATVHFVGGLMKSTFAEKVINEVQQRLSNKAPRFRLVNCANSHVAVEFVRANYL